MFSGLSSNPSRDQEQDNSPTEATLLLPSLALETTFLQITVFLNTHLQIRSNHLVILLQSKSLKKCRKNYGNQFTHKS